MSLDWRRFILVVDENDRMLACGQVKPHNDGTRELASLAVQPGSRGQGLARLVIEHLQAQFGAPLYLTCRSDLEPLYEKFDFQVVSFEKMPPYFRRLARFVSLLRGVFRIPLKLSIMLWDQ